MKSRRRIAVRIAAASLLAETLVLWQRGYGLGGDVVVRCREGHLFTTIWIPGISVKSLRFLWWRLERCPVGGHWSVVTPVAELELTPDERATARATKDIRIP
jgi:hypothetical protein